jgi:hypothetical protein
MAKDTVTGTVGLAKDTVGGTIGLAREAGGALVRDPDGRYGYDQGSYSGAGAGYGYGKNDGPGQGQIQGQQNGGTQVQNASDRYSYYGTLPMKNGSNFMQVTANFSAFAK